MEFKMQLRELEKVVNAFKTTKRARNHFEDRICVSATSDNRVFFRLNLQDDILVKGKAVVKEEGSAVCLLDAKDLKHISLSVNRRSLGENDEINFKKVKETIKVTIDGRDVDFEVNILLISCADNVIEVKVDPKETEILGKYVSSMPPNIDRVIEIDAMEIKAILGAVLHCIYPDHFHSALSCLLMKVQDNKLTMVGTDGVKLNELTADLPDVGPDFEAMVPFHCAFLLKSVLNEESVKIYIEEGQIYFDMDGIVVFGKLTNDEEYLNYGDFFNASIGGSFKMSNSRLKTIIKRIRKHTNKEDNHRITFFTNEKGISLKVEKPLELHSITCPVDVVGEIDCDFNAVFLLEQLESMSGENVEIRLTKAGYLIIYSENKEQRALLTALRRKNDVLPAAANG